MPGGALLFSGRRQPSCDGMSRMMREYHVRFCEGLGVKFPGPTRHKQTLRPCRRYVCFTPDSRHSSPTSAFLPIASALPPAPDVEGTLGDGLKLTQSRPAGDEVCGRQAYRNSRFCAPPDSGTLSLRDQVAGFFDCDLWQINADRAIL